MHFLLYLYPGDKWAGVTAVALCAVGAVLLIGIVVAWTLRRYPATRYLVLLSALVSAVACPFLAVAYALSGTSTAAIRLVVPNTNPSFADGAEVAEAEPANFTLPVDDIPTDLYPTESEATPVPEPIAGQAIAPAAFDPSEVTSRSQVDRIDVFRAATAAMMLAWCCGVTLLLVFFSLSWRRLHNLRRKTRTIPAESLHAVHRDIRRALGIDECPTVLSSDMLRSPIATGIFRPAIILPTALLTRISKVELRDVLIHETAHILRRDSLMKLLQAVARIAFWPIPFVHMLNRQLDRARDEVCDNYVLKTSDPISYGRTLLQIGEFVQRARPHFASVGILNRRGSLESRIANLLDKRRNRTMEVSRAITVALFGAFTVLGVFISGTTIVGQQQESLEKPAVPESAAEATEQRTPSRSAASGSSEERSQPPGASLEGIWSVASMRDNGQKLPLPTVVKLRFEFSDKELKIRSGEQVLAETDYAADATKEPATIDLTYEGQPTPGIYQLNGDALKICLGRSADRRPTFFGSGPNSPNRVLVTLDRGDLGPQGRHMFVVGIDGKGLHKLADFPKDLEMGSPDWSPDGKKITFDAWRLARGEEGPSALVYVVNADGTGLEALGPGANPSWSPDSKRISFARYGPRPGLWVMNADGSEQRLVDGQAWSCDWSPTANEIVTRVNRGYSAPNISIIDPDTGKSREVLKREEFKNIYWNLVWSPDGKWVCFKGVRPDDTQEIVTVNAQGEDHGFKVLVSTNDEDIKAINPIVAWGGEPGVILVPLRVGDSKLWQIYLVDPEGEKPLKRLPGQHADVPCAEMAMSPDGKQVVYAARKAK